MPVDIASDQTIVELIQKSPILMGPEKNYLIDKVPAMGPLDKLKTKKNLMMNTTPELILEFRKTREKFIENEKKGQAEANQDQSNKFFQAKPKPKKVISHSILGNPGFLGGPSPRPKSQPFLQTKTLNDIKNPNQLNSLIPPHVSFSINENSKQMVRIFVDKITGQIKSLQSPNEKRNYLALYLQSPLYRAYINTGLTALKHPEIKPANTILNTIQKIDRRFLNRKQFELASEITQAIRTSCGL